jgi:putative transposase
MSLLRRYYSAGYVYFVTVVTYDRKPILTDNYDLFNRAMEIADKQIPFKNIAGVILPEHFHTIIDPGDGDLSEIIKRIKLSFGGQYRDRYGLKSGRLWQLRFWDHVIRNTRDMNRHIDYIHYNPVRHGLVRRPIDYEYSSFGAYMKQGYYSSDWGVNRKIEVSGEFGE